MDHLNAVLDEYRNVYRASPRHKPIPLSSPKLEIAKEILQAVIDDKKASMRACHRNSPVYIIHELEIKELQAAMGRIEG